MIPQKYFILQKNAPQYSLNRLVAKGYVSFGEYLDEEELLLSLLN